MHPDLPPLSREESSYLDGALPPEAARRLRTRIDADPELRARLDAWRTRMDLWRDDAARQAAGLDPDRVLRAALGAPDREATAEVEAARAVRRYAAAAAALLAVGVGGSAWLSLRDTPVAPTAALQAVEQERMEIQGMFELLALPVAHPATKGG